MNESDVVMADKFGAVIYAFNTTAQSNAEKEADTKNISIRSSTLHILCFFIYLTKSSFQVSGLDYYMLFSSL